VNEKLRRTLHHCACCGNQRNVPKGGICSKCQENGGSGGC
jgi:hypothetical protein